MSICRPDALRATHVSRPLRTLVAWLVIGTTSFVALLSFGCATTNVAGETERTLSRSRRVIGTMTAERFVFEDRRLSIALSNGELAPSSDWHLANVTDDSTSEELVSKQGDAWVRELLFDVEGSGIDDSREFVPRYDLLFRHRTTGASLSIRTHPLSRWASEISLRALADARIDADSAEMAYAIAHGTSAEVAVDATERLAIARGGAFVAVDHAEAYAFEYAIVDAHRYELGLAQSPYRVRTVFVRPPWRWSLAGRRWPVILEVTLSARDVDFETAAPALDDLVRRLELTRVVERGPFESDVMAAIRACVEDVSPQPRTMSIRFSRRGTNVVAVSVSLDGRSEQSVSSGARVPRCVATAVEDERVLRPTVTTIDFPRSDDPPGVEAFSPAVWSHLAVSPSASLRRDAPSSPASADSSSTIAPSSHDVPAPTPR